MRITEQMSGHAYAIARDVYKGAITRARGLARLVDRVHMNEASASSLIDNFRSMLNGDEYQRTMNYYTTNLYLEHIRSDFGAAEFRNALLALEKHLDYYDSLEVGKHPKLRRLLAKLKQTLNGQSLFPDEIDPEELVEGAGRQVTVNAYERNSEARQACLNHYGLGCAVCGFDFRSVYGDIGDGFIHVHHLVELSSIRRKYVVDPVKDLRPVCPNCHAMLHRQRPPLTIEALRARIKKRKG